MYKKATPTPSQTRAMEVARVGAMSQAPFFCHFFYNMMEEYPTLDMPTAATDGRRLFYNPEFIAGLTPQEAVFVLVHEIQHAVMRHPQRMKSYAQTGQLRGLPFDAGLFNVCADFVINADLVATNVGRMNPSWLLDPQVGGMDLVEDVYFQRYKKQPPGGGGQGPGGSPGGRGNNPTRGGQGRPDKQAEANGGRFDEILPPQQDPVSGREDVPSDAQFNDAIAQAAAAAKAVGKLPGSVERMVEEILAPTVSWREHVRMLLTGRLGARRETWQRPNRRRLVLNPIIYVPGRRGYGAELVTVVIDNSGSISSEEYDAFYAEVGGVLADVRPKNVMVIWCDAEVRRVETVRSLDELEGVRVEPTPGGGGTSFIPPFEYLAERDIKPETLIYLTDLYGGFPPQPDYPVVWAATTDQKVPWGDVVRIKL